MVEKRNERLELKRGLMNYYVEIYILEMMI